MFGDALMRYPFVSHMKQVDAAPAKAVNFPLIGKATESRSVEAKRIPSEISGASTIPRIETRNPSYHGVMQGKADKMAQSGFFNGEMLCFDCCL